MNDLPLQVRRLNHIKVDDAQVADAGRCKVERRGRTEPTRANEQHPRVEQLRLTLSANARKEQVARVARLLLWCERCRFNNGESRLRPTLDAARH